MDTPPRRRIIDVLLFDKVNLLDVAGPVQAFEVARFKGEKIYQTRFLSLTGCPVTASCGLVLGARVIIGIGLSLLSLAALTAAHGLTAPHFYTSLVILGVGWNFGFIGATNLLTAAAQPEDRALAQGANDTVIALVSAACAFASGALVTGPGWRVLALVALSLLLAVGVVNLLSGQKRPSKTLSGP